MAAFEGIPIRLSALISNSCAWGGPEVPPRCVGNPVLPIPLKELNATVMRSSLALFLLIICSLPLTAQDTLQDNTLEIYGRLTDGENKLPGCQVTVYKDNDQVGDFPTDKGGKFDVALALNAIYSIEFRKEGFAPKRILIDTHMPPARLDTEVMIAPIGMDISLLDKAKYEGANTDELDFPFAIVKWSKGDGAFVQDQEYTMGMQRTNGALLLMAARKDMKR